jgi:hypothetical protein
VTAIGSFGLVVGAIHLFTPYNSAYLGDIFDVVSQTSAVRHTADQYVQLVQDHLWEFVLCAAALVATWASGRISLLDAAFVGGAVGASIFVLEYSGGVDRGLPLLVIVLLIIGELARRSGETLRTEKGVSGGDVAALAVFGMAVAVAALPILNATAAMYLYATKLERAQSESRPSLAGIYVPSMPEPPIDGSHASVGHDLESHTRFNQARAAAMQLEAWDYLPIVLEGVALLESFPHDEHSVVTFEQTNPFSFALAMRPPRYGYPLNFVSPRLLRQFRETLTLNQRFDPVGFFSDADYVMIPIVPFKRSQLEGMNEIYGEYVDTYFYEVGSSPHWRLYARR